MTTEPKTTAMEESKSEIYLHARQTKLLIWSDLTRGGCEQTNGQLELRSDGTGRWSCITRSPHTHGTDVWHSDFVVKAENGSALFSLGPFYSPLMEGGAEGKEYRWSAAFTFPVGLFDAIHSAVQNCECLPRARAVKQAPRPEVVVDKAWCRIQVAPMLAGGAYA